MTAGCFIRVVACEFVGLMRFLWCIITLVLSGFCCDVHYLRAMYMNSIPQDSSSNGKLFIYHHRKTMVIEDVGGKVDG